MSGMADVRAVFVALQPPPEGAVRGRTLVVIDTLRATTVLTTLLAGGAERVFPCASIAEARALHQELPGAYLCGERGGLPAEGFDFGNSPTEFAALDVRGWTLVQATSNGTRALALTREAAHTIVACLRNRDAAAQAALEQPHDIAIVCSGEDDGQRPSLEDTFSAGAVVVRMLRLEPELVLDSGARIAHKLFEAYGRSPAAAFDASPHAASLRTLQFDADLEFAAALDVESCVPRATLDATLDANLHKAGRVVVAREEAP